MTMLFLMMTIIFLIMIVMDRDREDQCESDRLNPTLADILLR